MTKDKVLHCVLKKQWFEKIKSGEKTHEYREVKKYWGKRICLHEKREIGYIVDSLIVDKVRFTLGMTSEPEKVMLFKIKRITITWGENTDLAIENLVYDIELAERLE